MARFFFTSDMQGHTVRHGWKISEQQANRYVFLSPPHPQQQTRRTPQTGKHIVPTTCGLRPFLADPRYWRKSFGCNEISYRFFNETQYYILSGPPVFPVHTRPTQIRTEERINTNQEKKFSQHWISKSGPVSPDCWDLVIYEFPSIYLFIMDEAEVPAGGPQDGPLMCSVGRESAHRVQSARHPIQSAIVGPPSATNLALIKLAPNYPPQTQISFNLS